MARSILKRIATGAVVGIAFLFSLLSAYLYFQRASFLQHLLPYRNMLRQYTLVENQAQLMAEFEPLVHTLLCNSTTLQQPLHAPVAEAYPNYNLDKFIDNIDAILDEYDTAKQEIPLAVSTEEERKLWHFKFDWGLTLLTKGQQKRKKTDHLRNNFPHYFARTIKAVQESGLPLLGTVTFERLGPGDWKGRRTTTVSSLKYILVLRADTLNDDTNNVAVQPQPTLEIWNRRDESWKLFDYGSRMAFEEYYRLRKDTDLLCAPPNISIPLKPSQAIVYDGSFLHNFRNPSNTTELLILSMDVARYDTKGWLEWTFLQAFYKFLQFKSPSMLTAYTPVEPNESHCEPRNRWQQEMEAERKEKLLVDGLATEVEEEL